MQQAVRHVTARDIAAHLGMSTSTVYDCLNSRYSSKYQQSTVERVRSTAKQMGYVPRAQRAVQVAAKAYTWKKPANGIFKSREEETAAMSSLRVEGNTNVEIAHRCGVSLPTVNRRIGAQPAELTACSCKLAGAVRSAKNRIKRSYQAQQQIAQYNELAAKLNKQLEEAKATALQLKAIQSSAKKAAKITGMQLVTVSNIVQ